MHLEVRYYPPREPWLFAGRSDEQLAALWARNARAFRAECEARRAMAEKRREQANETTHQRNVHELNLEVERYRLGRALKRHAEHFGDSK